MSNSKATITETPTIHSVLLIAYGCEPNASSEPGVGWNFAREISTFTKVHLITRANNKPSIDAALLHEPQSMRDNISWTYIDIAFLSKLKNKVPLGIQLYYALWQWKAMFVGRKLVKNNNFSLCHHLTYGVMWLSPVTAFIMKPFIWGPIGGGDVIPWKFLREQSVKNIIHETAYSILSRLIPRVSPIAIAARKRTSTIIFRTRSTSKLYPIAKHINKFVMCETAFNEPIVKKDRAPNNHLNIICLGRQTYWKGYIYAIKGFHEYLKQGGKGKLVFLGKGPEFHAVRSYCDKHKLHSHVSLPGHVSHDEAQRILSKSNILLHPSFRDGGSWAVLEAMGQGIPVICLNRSGLADMVDKSSGILLEVDTPDKLTQNISKTLLDLESNPYFVRTLSDGATKRVNSAYRWKQRRKQLLEIYTDSLESQKHN
ncbi:glycosyltransferase [Candidatus Pacearchaeota archaeon]|nr:glycosyltransferase [Candidatus Pacearchaeota archaeon]